MQSETYMPLISIRSDYKAGSDEKWLIQQIQVFTLNIILRNKEDRACSISETLIKNVLRSYVDPSFLRFYLWDTF